MKMDSRDEELQRQAEALAALPDETIDTTDIPELPEEAWVHARRPGLRGNHKAAANDRDPIRKAI